MKIDNQLIEETICDIVGEDLPPLLNLLLVGKPNISEFKLAEQLNITVNQVRSMLYRMQEHNLVDFIRKKDKRKGWYIYYWTLNKRNTFGLLKEYKRKQLEDLKNRLAREQAGGFFVCPMGCARMKMDQAMEVEFRCQECGSLVKEQNNSRTVENIRRMIKEIETELAEPLVLEGALKNVLRKKPERRKKKVVKKKVVEEKPVKDVKKKIVKKKTIKKVKKKIVKKKVVKKKVKKKAVKRKVKKKIVKKKVKRKPMKKKIVKKKVKRTPKKKVVKKKAPKKKSFLRKVKKLIKKQ